MRAEFVVRESGHFTRLIGEASFRDYHDLLEFRSVEAEVSRHLDDLIRIHEIRALGAESIYTGSKLAALHCLRGFQTQAAATLFGVKQAKIADNHFMRSLRMRMDHSPYAIRK